MKTKYLIIMFLAGMSLISCTPCVTEKPEHEVESIDELIDSIAFRSNGGVTRTIQCYKDTLLDCYHIITSAQDTMGLDTLDVDAWYKRLLANVPPKSVRDTMKFYREPNEMRRDVENHQYMIRNATHLLEKLCKTAKESYRYIDKDSIDYSITLSKNPKQLLKAKRWNVVNTRNEFYVSYIKRNHVKLTAEPYDRRPVQQLLKNFLAEYKNVRQYQVSFDWDEGLPFPSYDVCDDFYLDSGPKNNKDSLAASHVTGTHYIIPVAEEKYEEVKTEITKRILRMTEKQPIPGSYLSLGLHTKGKNKYYMLDSYGIRTPIVYWVPTYQIRIGYWGRNTIHILELNSNGSKRYAIPYNWESVLRTHNTDIEYIRHTKEKNTEESDTKEYIDYNFFNH